eukprot:351563-Chlamydomonas_euryale.AAC.6
MLLRLGTVRTRIANKERTIHTFPHTPAPAPHSCPSVLHSLPLAAMQSTEPGALLRLRLREETRSAAVPALANLKNVGFNVWGPTGWLDEDAVVCRMFGQGGVLPCSALLRLWHCALFIHHVQDRETPEKTG